MGLFVHRLHLGTSKVGEAQGPEEGTFSGSLSHGLPCGKFCDRSVFLVSIKVFPSSIEILLFLSVFVNFLSFAFLLPRSVFLTFLA